MRQTIKKLVLLGVLSLVLRLAAAETADDAPPEPLPPLEVQHCFACHGPAGRSGAPAIPALAGQPRRYLYQALQGYRHGGRFGTLMGRLLQGFSDAQLFEMADYFSRQAALPVKQRVDWDLVSRGRQLHRLYCRDCHGDEQREPEDDVPRLNGQWMDYLRWTLQDYLLGANEAEEEMSDALIRLLRRHGDGALEALIHYYGSVRPQRGAP